MIVYKAVNKENGKCYVGQTVQTLDKRKYGHIFGSKNGEKSYPFHRALLKYGEENFEWSILCECNSKEEMNEKEIYYIQELKSHIKEGKGYNLTLGGGGNLGWCPTEETRRKISESNKGKQLGIPKSEGHKKKIGLGQLGNKRPYQEGDNNVSKRPDVRKKISDALKGKKKAPEHIKKVADAQRGRKASDETKRKMSESHKGKLLGSIKTEEQKNKQRESMSKYTYTITTPTGDVEITNSLRNFCKINNVDRNWLKKSYHDNIQYKGWYVTRTEIG